MYRALAFAALFVTGNAAPQAVTAIVTPSGTAPEGCVPTGHGRFGLEPKFLDPMYTRSLSLVYSTNASSVHRIIVGPNHESSVEQRSTGLTQFFVNEDGKAVGHGSNDTSCLIYQPGDLAVTLSNGVLHDSLNRTGYIADNFQFQFDNPPQAGAISTAGYTICKNDSLALGSRAVWWLCLSGTFYNMYDRYWAAQCLPALMQLRPYCDASGHHGAVPSRSKHLVADQWRMLLTMW